PDTPDGFTLTDPRITESSGLAASRAHQHIYWTHNDSDDGPYVYGVDGRTGRTVATVTLRGISPRDVEAISVGPDGNVYVGDIGDNFHGKWPEVWIYRFPEPERLRKNITVTPTRYTVRYADGPRDAESLMVHPKSGRVYIVSKSDKGRGAIYAGPKELSPSGVNTFSRLAKTDVFATDGAFSPDGTRLVLRSYFSARMYEWKRGGKPPEAVGTVSVPFQRQGESVTFTRDGRTLMLGSEGENSKVEPVALRGRQRPDNVRRAEPDSDSDSSKGEGTSSGAATGNEGTDGRLILAGVTFAVALGLWLTLRRVFRRRD
ncbi:esterase-like activity of phytase family protein, partial [Streptomyces boncukensis]